MIKIGVRAEAQQQVLLLRVRNGPCELMQVQVLVDLALHELLHKLWRADRSAADLYPAIALADGWKNVSRYVLCSAPYLTLAHVNFEIDVTACLYEKLHNLICLFHRHEEVGIVKVSEELKTLEALHGTSESVREGRSKQ